jgi:hypothetical protein
MRPDLFIVGRAETEDATQKLKRAGADRVISPYQIGAVQIAQTALRPAVVDFVELATSSENIDLAMEEITIAASSPLASRSILDANLRQRYGVIVVGHSAAGSIDGVQSRAGYLDSRRRQARGARTARVAAPPRGRGRRPDDGEAASTAPPSPIRSALNRRRPSPRSRLVPDARRAWRSSSWATTRICHLRTEQTEIGRGGGLRTDLERLPATASLDELLSIVAV